MIEEPDSFLLVADLWQWPYVHGTGRTFLAAHRCALLAQGHKKLQRLMGAHCFCTRDCCAKFPRFGRTELITGASKAKLARISILRSVRMSSLQNWPKKPTHKYGNQQNLVETNFCAEKLKWREPSEARFRNVAGQSELRLSEVVQKKFAKAFSPLH